jgi:queuine/archaeosine tRNA-ribosyltransferase
MYLIHKILAPNGYVLNGQVTWQGEETGDVGEIYVENNKVFTEPYHGKKNEFTLEHCEKFKNVMRTDIVLDEETMKAVNIKSLKKSAQKEAKKEIEKAAPVKVPVKKTPKKKTVSIKIEGLKEDLSERQMKSLMNVIRQYTEGLVDKKESEYTVKFKRTELKAR